ncbi:MAG TPA: exodeoxyribonuclease VII large subunit, partial [Burkholderiaceae bacterium]
MPNTYIAVPFKAKDSAKALGARWDRDAGQWYVPPGLDLALFAEWLPESSSSSPRRDVASTIQSANLQPAPRGVPLSRLLQGVAKAVAEAYSTGVWTTAEVLRASTKDGHVYLELSERDADGRVLAKAQAAIWARTAERIVPEFERDTGATLGAGIKLLVRARPVYKPQYGFSLDIDAIDPNYTLGDLEAKKREIRERLKREQLFDLNKRLPAPWDFRAVLVVAPKGGAGLGDFSKEADRLERFAVCRFTYVHSRFQGEGAAGEILEALQVGLAQFSDDRRPDAVILIRGGGAVNDLAWLNDYELARFVCECPIPVLTGIGHERDSTVLDEVAHSSYDTPSKVVAGIEQLVTRRARGARVAFEYIVNHGMREAERMRAVVEKLEREVKSSASSTIADARAQCSQLMADLRLDSVRSVHSAATQVQELYGNVRNGSSRCIAEAKQGAPVALNTVKAEALSALRAAKVQLRATLPVIFDRAGLDTRRALAAADGELESVVDRSRKTIRAASDGAQALIREIAGQGPQKTLGRGFAIVRGADGKTLTSAQSAASTESIEIAFKDGKVDAAVRDIKLGISDE